MIKILIVEDDTYRVKFFIERFGEYDLTIIETAPGAIEYLKDEVFDYIFLDNDLGTGNGEGVDVAEFLSNDKINKNNKAIVIIHSWNRPAANRIKAMIPNAVYAPFNTENFFSLRLDI